MFRAPRSLCKYHDYVQRKIPAHETSPDQFRQRTDYVQRHIRVRGTGGRSLPERWSPMHTMARRFYALYVDSFANSPRGRSIAHSVGHLKTAMYDVLFRL